MPPTDYHLLPPSTYHLRFQARTAFIPGLSTTSELPLNHCHFSVSVCTIGPYYVFPDKFDKLIKFTSRQILWISRKTCVRKKKKEGGGKMELLRGFREDPEALRPSEDPKAQKALVH